MKPMRKSPYNLRRLAPCYPYTSKLREYISDEDVGREELLKSSKRELTSFEDMHFFLPSILPPQISSFTFLKHFSKSSPLRKNDKRLNPLFYRIFLLSITLDSIAA